MKPLMHRICHAILSKKCGAPECLLGTEKNYNRFMLDWRNKEDIEQL